MWEQQELGKLALVSLLATQQQFLPSAKVNYEEKLLASREGPFLPLCPSDGRMKARGAQHRHLQSSPQRLTSTLSPCPHTTPRLTVDRQVEGSCAENSGIKTDKLLTQELCSQKF